uniref:Reverse transcriptase zinc-binding domain-containing protein n=1 Tax=Aegilops tauschii subsp. strangulata TaxID=200361 RepID=A0A453T9S6_AEGTS
EVVVPNIGSRDIVMFWQDNWLSGSLSVRFPELFSFSKNEFISVKSMKMTEDPIEHFHTPLSIQAYELFQQLSKIVQNTALTNAHDKWCYPWQNPEYSSIKMYHQLQEQEKAPPSFAKIWKCTAMLRYKIFIWLLLHDRVNVRNLLHRKKIILPNYKCELCNCSTEETTLHVFWDCPFALSCWDSITQDRKRGVNVLDEITIMAESFSSHFSMNIVIMGSWHIWMQRNSKLFQAKTPSLQSWRTQLRNDLLLILHRTKVKHRETFKEWIDSYLT